MRTIDDQARQILRHYPRLYVACHNDHKNRKGQGAEITARDQTILAHIPDAGVRPRALAAHLEVAPSTLSAALKRLAAMALTSTHGAGADARGKIIHLTAAGREALAASSVLDLKLVRSALMQLEEAERALLVATFAKLADAAVSNKGGK